MVICHCVMTAGLCLLCSQTTCRVFLGTGSKNSSNMSSAVTKPLRLALSIKGPNKMAGKRSSVFFLAGKCFPDCFQISSRPWPHQRPSTLLFTTVLGFLILAAMEVNMILCSDFPYFITCSNSVCCQFAGGQCRDQVHHSCGEDIYIRADERDVPERLWTFVKTLR